MFAYVCPSMTFTTVTTERRVEEHRVVGYRPT
jgi:hypothetical protein